MPHKVNRTRKTIWARGTRQVVKENTYVDDNGNTIVGHILVEEPFEETADIPFIEVTTISEADDWRERYPADMVGLDDEGVLAMIPKIREANEAREKYGHNVFGDKTALEVLAKRDELVKEEEDRKVQAAQAAKEQAEADLARMAVERQAMMDEIRKQILAEMKQ